MTTANKLTLIRIAMVPVFLIFAAMDGMVFSIIALLVFCIASLTDMVDGYVARHYDQVTDFGKLVDPLADKLLVMSAILIFVSAGRIPVWAATIILGREFAVTSLRMVAAANGVVIAAGKSGKFKTLVQCVTIITFLLLRGFSGVPAYVWIIGYIAMTVVSLVSCADYFITNRGVLKGSLSKSKE